MKKLLLFLCLFTSLGMGIKALAQNNLDNAGLSTTSARGAYSIRKLSSTYTGFVLKARRVSDNAEANIAFDGAGTISGASLATVTAVGTSGLTVSSTLAFSSFYAGTDVRVMTWYDQSGNANDITQTVTASMPKIANAGVLNLLNGKPALSFATVSMNIPISCTLLNTQGSIAAVHSQSALQSGYTALLSWQDAIGVGFGPLNSAGQFGLYNVNNFNAAPVINTNVAINTTYASNATWTNSNANVTESRNKSASTGSLAYRFSATVANGTLGNNGGFFVGNVPELIIFTTPLTTLERQALENNQFASFTSNLSALTTTAGTISPAFAAGTTAYTASVPTTTTSVTVTPTVADATATVQVRVNSGTYTTVTSGSASSALALNIGTNPIDVKVTAQDGTTIKTYTITVRRGLIPPGNALNFDGSNDYIQVAQTAATKGLGTGSFTLEAMVYPTNISSVRSVIRKNGDYNLYLNGGKVGFEVWSGGENIGNATSSTYKVITGNITVPANKWTHIAGVWDGSNVTIYVNGVLDVSAAPSSGFVNGTEGLRIGTSQTYLEYFLGNLDEVRIWNTNRTQPQIQTNMLTTVSPSSTGLVLYYGFDHGVAGATNTGVTAITDLTANAQTGTLTNFGLTAGNTSNWVESYAMVVPTTTAATSLGSASFTANWTAPALGTVDNGYRLDVSTSSTFGSFVSGYNGLTVAGTSQAVTGLNASTNYYYRVRADKTSVTGQGSNSASIIATTLMVPPGNALQFDGANDNVTALIPLTNINNFTMEGWINPASFGSFQRLFSYGFDNNAPGSNGLDLVLGTGGGLYMNFNGISTIYAGYTLPIINQWYHLAITRASGVTKVFVNGVQTPTTNSTTPIIPTAFRLGAGTGYAFYNGKMDEFRFYNIALTAVNIQADMLSTSSAVPASLVAYYNFDQGTAGGTNTGITSLPDLTSNAYNGTLNNFALTGSTSNWVESYAMVVPTATSATSVASTSFTANWTASAVGKVDNGYRLDVSTSATFASFVTGYNGLTVAGLSQAVTGLSSSTPYYYRVRADKTSVTGQGGYSTSIITTTAASTNANLSALTLSEGSLSPSFAANTITYTSFVGSTVNDITVTPTNADANATIQVRINAGTYATVTSGAASGSLTLNEGDNTVDVKVTAEDATTTKTYSITVTKATVLPVSFISFDAKFNKTGSVDLTWLTASEKNNSHFIILKSADGVNFSELVKIYGKGDSKQQNRYQTADGNPVKGNNYYQLVQYDVDGKVTILSTRVVNVNLDDDKNVTVYPNPAQEVVNVKFAADIFNSVKLIDMTGKVLIRKSIDKGNSAMSLAISSLPSGSYIIRLEGKADVVNTTLIKK